MNTNYTPNIKLMNKFLKEGYYFGYKDCCINDYSYRGHIDSTTQEQKLAVELIFASGFAGYVPCPSCAKKVLDGTYKRLTDMLVMHRRNLPLPEDIPKITKTSDKIVNECVFPEKITKGYLRYLEKTMYYCNEQKLRCNYKKMLKMYK